MDKQKHIVEFIKKENKEGQLFYEVFSHDMCCHDFESTFRGGYFGTNEPYDNVVSYYLASHYDERDIKHIDFCPFCGNKVEYKCIRSLKELQVGTEKVKETVWDSRQVEKEIPLYDFKEV